MIDGLDVKGVVCFQEVEFKNTVVGRFYFWLLIIRRFFSAVRTFFLLHFKAVFSDRMSRGREGCSCIISNI